MAGSSSDDEVICGAKRGDQEAWHELYLAHASRLAVWLRSLPSGDASVDQDDIAATAWLTAAGRIADFSGSSSDFAGWLFGIARNVAMNTRARSVRRATAPSDGSDGEIWGTQPDWSPSVDGSEWARSLLKQLPPREAEVVACLDVVGLDVSATATILGIGPSAVRVAHHRGLRRLRSLLTDRQPVGPHPWPVRRTNP